MIKLNKPTLAVLASASLLAACATAPEESAPVADAAPAAPSPAMAHFLSDGPAADAPPQLLHFAPLIGDWSIQGERRDADGAWARSPNEIARWSFRYALDGYAIADMWTAPAHDVDLRPDQTRQVGINLRIYWPDRDEWEMTWVSPGWGMIPRYTATSDGNVVVMQSTEENQNGALQRITFHEMTGDSFSWRSENSTDSGESWTENMRLYGTRLE